MSSFFVIINKNHSSAKDHSHLFLGYSKEMSNNIEIYYKGYKDTLLFSFVGEKKFIISGLGIQNSNQPKFLLKSDWEKILDNNVSRVNQLDGHFAGSLIEGGQVYCFNDKLGLREIYYYDDEEVICISTRVDLFNRLFNLTLSEAYLAGQWLTTCPPFFVSPYNEVKRLQPGGSLVVNQMHKISITNSRLTFTESRIEIIKEEIRKLTLVDYPGKNTSLGLSGGLDSRALLAIMLNNKYDNFWTHTFGSKNMSDVKIAMQIANKMNLNHNRYSSETVSADEAIKFIKNFIPFTGLTIPISDLIHIDYHRKLYDSNLLIQDGGFGEIGRRQYLNKFLLNGKKILAHQRTEEFITALRITKADVFQSSFEKELNEKLLINSEFVWENMRDIPSNQKELWADMFMTRFKIPNGYSYGQHCLDQHSVAYMPFAQPSLLQMLLSLSSVQKKSGKLYRSIIKSNKESLEQINLVKDYVEYPYACGTLSSHVVRKFKRKFGNVKTVDPIKYKLYDNLREYIGDEISSKVVQENSYYDLNKIWYYFDEYYSGNKSVLSQLDWWLTFNEWFKIYYSS